MKLKAILEYLYYKYIKGYSKQDFEQFQKNVTIKQNHETAHFVDEKDCLPKPIEKEEKQPVKIKSLDRYREALKSGKTDFDFSELITLGGDIQNLNLENVGCYINLRNIFVPFGHRRKMENDSLPLLMSYGDCFLFLNKANLKGNNVEGDLSPFHDSREGNVYFWYSEDTFDKAYKEKYPFYFLDANAPQELKEIYYNPTLVKEKIPTIHNIDGEEVTYLKRQTLSFQEYMKYYQFLRGKYLGNFNINGQELFKINIVERYGLEQAKEILINLSYYPLPLNQLFDLLSKMNDSELNNALLSYKDDTENSVEIEEILQTLDSFQTR